VVRGRLAARGLDVELDDREGLTPGAKYHEWELAGVPLRIELGPKDLAKGSVVCVKRVGRQKSFVPLAELEPRVQGLLDEIQREMYEAARARRDAATFPVDDYDEFKRKIEDPGGFLLAHWCGDAMCEARVQDETKATIRCLAFDQPEERGRCVVCAQPSPKRAHFAKAY
jgi:prolyl-tRNA synthetase